MCVPLLSGQAHGHGGVLELHPGEALCVDFTVSTNLSKAPDFMMLRLGTVGHVSPFTLRSTALYDGTTLLGVHTSTKNGQKVGNAFITSLFNDSGSYFDCSLLPIIIPFESIKNGKIVGHFEFTISTGQMNIDPANIRVSLGSSEFYDSCVASVVTPQPVITSVAVGPQCFCATYCTAKTGLVCGTPSISCTGLSSATASSGFVITAAPARTCRLGLLLYSTAPEGKPYPPFGGAGDGRLCLLNQNPLHKIRKAGWINSGGTSGPFCDGAFSIDMNSFSVGQWTPVDCAGTPMSTFTPQAYLTTPGTTVYVQMWGQDTPGSQFLSDALSYTVGH
jgi:hypothetical protein